MPLCKDSLTVITFIKYGLKEISIAQTNAVSNTTPI